MRRNDSPVNLSAAKSNATCSVSGHEERWCTPLVTSELRRQGELAQSSDFVQRLLADRVESPGDRQPGTDKSRPDSGECEVVALAAEHARAWDDFIEAHPDGTIFHTLAWRRAVGEAFGHRDLYLLARRRGRVVGVLPLFLVQSRIAGRRLVSVPYGVGGGILATDVQAGRALFEWAKAHASELRCSFIDLRGARASIPELPIVPRYVNFSRELPGDAAAVLPWLPRKARADARTAREKHRLSVSVGDEHLPRVWHLYTVSMRRLASLAYPLRYFEALVRHTPGRHWVSLVCWEGRPVAGLVTFLYKDRVMPYFIGTTDEARRCHAAHFIYLTTMEQGAASGYRVFDFGRSRCGNPGSYNFKRFCGFEPHPLEYQCYTLPGRRAWDIVPDNAHVRAARRIWPHLPLRLTQVLGARLAHHITG